MGPAFLHLGVCQMDKLVVDEYRAAAVALNTYFCDGYKGRSKTDPVYQYVVEKRDVPATYKSYSSCGDRAAAILYRLGCREKLCNRNENKGWKVGANISALAFGISFSKKPGKDWLPRPGDEMLIWNSQSGTDAHSLAVVDYKPSTDKATFAKDVAVTANFGAAGMSQAVFPGAIFRDSKLVFDSKANQWVCGTRIVQRVLTMDNLVSVFTAKPILTYLDGDMLPDLSQAYDRILAARPELK